MDAMNRTGHRRVAFVAAAAVVAAAALVGARVAVGPQTELRVLPRPGTPGR